MKLEMESIGAAVMPELVRQKEVRLTNWRVGRDAITFALSNVPRTFAPRKNMVRASYTHTGKDTHGESEQYFVLEIAGYLVRLSVFYTELGPQGLGYGAIYTGEARETALAQALASIDKVRYAEVVS